MQDTAARSGHWQPKVSLGVKSALNVILMTLFLGVGMVAFSYRTYCAGLEDQKIQQATHVAQTISQLVGADRVEHYFQSGQMDEAYYELASLIETVQTANEADLTCVVYPTQEGQVCIFSAGPDSDWYPFGTLIPNEVIDAQFEDYKNYRQDVLAGREVPPILYDVEGWKALTVSVPIRAEDGSAHGYVTVDLPMNEIAQLQQSFLFRLVRIQLVAGLLMMLLSIFAARHILVKPIIRLAAAARDFTLRQKDGSLAPTELEERWFRSNDEIGVLYRSVRQMEEDLLAYVKDLTAVTAEKERISTELDLAKRIQVSMLPCIFPPYPERKEFDLYASMDPAKEVGGDFYDFFLIDNDHLALVIADVSGKGIPAALFMVITKAMLKNSTQMGDLSPGQILEKVNRQLCENNSEEMFATAWLGILEISTGKLTCANAGHEYPALRRAGGPFELYRDKHGLALAAMPGVKYREYTLELAPGDGLFVYTDGVAEATRSDGELFGTQRMLEALNQVDPGEASRIPKQLRAAIDAFVEDAPQFDDITMLTLLYRGNETGSAE